jgi:hypothetical protein
VSRETIAEMSALFFGPPSAQVTPVRSRRSLASSPQAQRAGPCFPQGDDLAARYLRWRVLWKKIIASAMAGIAISAATRISSRENPA